MKTNRIARKIVKARNSLVIIAVLGMAAVSFESGHALAGQIARAVPQNPLPQPPAVTFDHLMTSIL